MGGRTIFSAGGGTASRLAEASVDRQEAGCCRFWKRDTEKEGNEVAAAALAAAAHVT